MSETRIRLDKQIQKAPAVNMFPLSDGNGELQYVDIRGIVKGNETLTRLNSVEITGGNLVIKYTPEDGNQQVVSTPFAYSQTDIKLADAKMDNPSAGVYRLILTESDGHSYPVDLSALLAVVTQGNQYFSLTGNGTPQNPLRVDPTSDFWNQVPRTLDALNDVVTPNEIIDEQMSKGGEVVLVFDYDSQQWMPKSSLTLSTYQETTETFTDMVAGSIVRLHLPVSQIVNGSIKVFRNGLRQALGADYDLGSQGEPNAIRFTTGFKNNFPETVIVDYRPATL